MAGIEIATGELMKMKIINTTKSKVKSFAEKFGLIGKGCTIRISQESKDYIAELQARGQRAVEAGKFHAKYDKTLYGGSK